ncbi:pectinesterase 2-like [Durio zibethinus]|uniref:pectinesterase n=1 Tax=Durio zibethinus TaxID=66656 RepID=A0A6P5ZUB0_DURZI|nr:pectinesterase 2-like [Durio zibethinus]
MKANIANGFNRTVLDQLLVKAEDAAVKVVKDKKNGSRDFDMVTAALDSIPSENMQRVVVWIGGGEYFEKITINRTKNFVTFYGKPTDAPKIVLNGTAAAFGS